jgi:hypothetical protein
MTAENTAELNWGRYANNTNSYKTTEYFQERADRDTWNFTRKEWAEREWDAILNPGKNEQDGSPNRNPYPDSDEPRSDAETVLSTTTDTNPKAHENNGQDGN